MQDFCPSSTDKTEYHMQSIISRVDMHLQHRTYAESLATQTKS